MKIFGFDLGIASIGWAIIEIKKTNSDPTAGIWAQGEIIDCGVRCFETAQNAADRRTARGARRRLRHRVNRMRLIRELLRTHQLIDIPEPGGRVKSNDVYLPLSPNNSNVWRLRAKTAFERVLSPEQFGRVLYHMAKHRGYDDITWPIKPSDKNTADDKTKEDQKAITAISGNKAKLERARQINPNTTMTQIIYTDKGAKGRMSNHVHHKHLHSGKNKKKDNPTYVNSIPRSEIEFEAKSIFDAQKKIGNHIATDELFNAWHNIALNQRKYNESSSPLYKSVESMVGKCIFENGCPCAPKESPTAEKFVALTRINNLRFNGRGELTSDERKQIFESLLNRASGLTYSQLRKDLNLPGTILFAGLHYGKTKKNKDNNIEKQVDPESEKFYEMKGTAKLRTAFGGKGATMPDDKTLDKIMAIVATKKTPDKIMAALANINISDEIKQNISKMSSSKFINLSLRALYNIVPKMADGMTYDKACDATGKYNHKKRADSFIDDTDDIGEDFLKRIDFKKLGNRITSPVVKRTLAQFHKVYNAMIQKHKFVPDQIHLEIGRDLKLSDEQRDKIRIEQSKNRAKNTEFGTLPEKLIHEQQNKCIYCGASLYSEHMDDYHVDHILPYSRSWDNSQNNKVLCCANCNMQKTNRTPWEWKQNTDWDAFECRVNLLLTNKRKISNLLNKTFTTTDEFMNRNACDNATISKYVERYLQDGTNVKKIQTRSGGITNYLRHQWGLQKNRDESDRHHAQDAVVIACATQDMVTFLNTWSGYVGKQALDYRKIFAEPWDGFRTEVENRIFKNDTFIVSRPKRAKATGPLHLDTINKKTKSVKDDVLQIRKGVAKGKGDRFRFDIFKKDGKYNAVAFYPSDIVEKNKDKSFVPNGFSVDDFVMTLYKDDYIKITTKAGVFDGYINAYSTKNSFELYDKSNRATFIISGASVVVPGDILLIDDIEWKVDGWDDDEQKIKLSNKNEIKFIDGEQQISAAEKRKLDDDKNAKIKNKKELKLKNKYTKKSKSQWFGINTITNIEKFNIGLLGGDMGSPCKVPEKRAPIYRKKNTKRRKQYKGVHNGLAHPSPGETVQNIG